MRGTLRRLFRGLPLVVLLTSTALADLRVSAPTDMRRGGTITAEKLWEELDRALPPGVWVSPLENREYAVVSAKWMRRSFLPALSAEMDSLRREHVPEEDSAGNCSGLALICRLMLNLSAMACHAPAPAVATMVVYQQKPFGGLAATNENHCVTFVLTDEGPWVIEVQTGEYIALSRYPNRATIKLVSVH